jgi:two-component system, chemotaxis family, protein-glutamate methylesterase/glutaminase
VFGMPREAIATGVVDRVVPLDGMVREIVYRSGLVSKF